MNVVRSRILSLLIITGLVVPAMQVAGQSCWGDKCALHLRQTDRSCGDAGADACCTTDAAEEREADEQGCCANGGCDCICCGVTAITALVRSTLSAVTITPRSAPVAGLRSAVRPQDAVGAPLRPPQA